MKYNKALKKLIDSLTEEEHKEIQKELSAKGKTKLRKLYKLYKSQDVPDLTKLSMTKNTVSVYQNKLKNRILESLVSNMDIVENRVAPLVNRATVLMGKGLYTESMKFLGKAKEICLSHDYFTRLLTINSIEIVLDNVGYNGVKLSGENLDNERVYYLEELTLETQLIKDFISLLNFGKSESFVTRQNENYAEISEKIERFKSYISRSRRSSKNLVHALRGLGQAYDLLGDFSTSSQYCKEIIKGFEESDFLMKTINRAYYNAVVSVAISSAKTRNKEDFHFVKKRILKLKNIEKRDLLYLNSHFPQSELDFQLRTNVSDEKILKTLHEFIDFIERNRDSLLKNVVFGAPLRIAQVYACLGHYDEARKWLVNSRDAYLREIEDNIYSNFYLYDLMIAYGEKVYQVLPSMAKNTRAYFKRSKSELALTELVLLEFFANKEMYKWSNKDHVLELGKLKEALIEIFDDNEQERRYWIWHFDWLVWIEWHSRKINKELELR